MKTQICILIATIFLAFSPVVTAQQVIASSGNTFGGNDISISWTLGETVSATMKNNQIMLTQGFQQPYNFYLTQILNIPAGWSGISSFLDPRDKGIESMFDPYTPDFVFLASMSGFYYPAEGTNTLGNWDSFTGYKIKANEEFFLSVKGNKVDQPEMLLEDGWNLIPVLNSCGVTTAGFHEELDSLVMVKEVGGAHVYWPAYGIKTLLFLEPGKAYFVRMDKSESYTFPVCSKNAYTAQPLSIFENITPWYYPVHTPESHVIAFPSGILSKSGIQEGDVLGVFTPGGICAGIQSIDDLSTDIAMVAFADDPFTPDPEGFTPGELFQFRIFRPGSQQEMEMLVHFDPGIPGKGLFQRHGLTAANSIHIQASAINESMHLEFEVYPNPSNGNFTLSIPCSADKFQILVLDFRGQIVRSMQHEYISSGAALQIDLKDLPAGVYILKLHCDNLTENKKIIIQ